MLVGEAREAFLATVHRRKTTHEAGHAVAAVARGGVLLGFTVPFDDFLGDAAAVGQPLVTHRTSPEHRPFITYAGLWAEARYMAATGEADDMPEALGFVTGEYAGPGHDITKLRAADVDPLDVPDAWDAELESLWSAMQRVTDHYIEVGEVDHATVYRAVERAGTPA